MRQVETCSSGLQHQPLSKLTAHSSSGAKRDPSPRRHEEPSRRRCDEPPRRDEPHRRSDDPSHNGGGTESDSKQQHGHEHDVKAEAAHLSDSTSAPCPVKDAEKEMLKKQLGEATEKAENMRKAMEKVRTAAVHWKGQHGKLKEEADAAAAAATGRVASLEAELEAACSQGAVAAEQLPAAQEAVKVMEAQVEAAQAAAAASAQAPSSSKLPQSIVAASEASVLARETALEDEDPEQLATPRLLALQEHLEQCKRIAELLARSPKSPKPLLVHWDLQISRRTLVPDVLAQFGQLTTGVAGGKGPLQLWRNTVVTFVNAFGVDEPGIDEGGLTNELHTTFWNEVFKPEHELFEGDHGRYLPRARAPTDTLEQHEARLRGLEATGRMLLKSIIDDHPTSRLLSRFVFEFLADSHERRVFLPSQPLEALRALEDFNPGLAKQWRWCVLEMGDEELSHLTLEEFEPSLGEGAVTRANVAEAVVAGCRSKLLRERQVELEALRRGFTFDSRMDLAMQLARSWVHIACPTSHTTSRTCPNHSHDAPVPVRASGSPESVSSPSHTHLTVSFRHRSRATS